MNVQDFLHANGLLYDATTTASDYDFQNKVVQFDDDPNNVASGESTIIFSGPPVLAKAIAITHGTNATVNDPNGLGGILVPIGAVQGWQESETPNVVPFPEIGSRLKRYAVGMANYSVSMSRVITMHSNLRNALYAWIAFLADNNAAGTGGPGLDFLMPPGQDTGAGHSHLTTSESDLMRVPFGLMAVLMSAGGEAISYEYYEKCYIQNIGKSVAAGQPLIQENVSITATRKVPVNNFTISESANRKAFQISTGNHWDKALQQEVPTYPTSGFAEIP